MSYKIPPTHRFEKELKRLVKKSPSIKNEFAQLITNLNLQPEQGNALGNGCFKIRLAIASKRKYTSTFTNCVVNNYINF